MTQPLPPGELAALADDLARDQRIAELTTHMMGLDLTSADGRAGLAVLVAELERLSPGAPRRMLEALEMRRNGHVTTVQ